MSRMKKEHEGKREHKKEENHGSHSHHMKMAHHHMKEAVKAAKRHKK